ncbi:hypothetical protein C8Q76DRAFT_697202 [Earliella scabrosa]|nr:hypothetical protein C8Q76DRAFT_697202 [Earliella scabrosa]
MSSFTLPSDVTGGILLSLYLSLTSDVMQRAQSVPTLSAFCVEWPRHLISILARKNPPPAHDWPSTVINVKSGYARTNRSATIEHLLQSHAGAPPRRGLTVTFLYTSEFPGAYTTHIISWSAVSTMAAQYAGAWVLVRAGFASKSIFPVAGAGMWLSFMGGLVMLYQRKKELRSARAVPANKREVVCITSGNGSTDAVVVVTEGGGAKLEDIAGGRAGGLDAMAGIALTGLIALWVVWVVAFTQLEIHDACCVLGIAALGTAQAIYAARTWRGEKALGFELANKEVVHEDKVMEALMRAENVESGVGLALLPVFFPGPLRPKEEEYWEARKGAPKSV